VRDAAPHASLTSPLPIPCSPPPCEPPRSVSRCVVTHLARSGPMRAGAVAPVRRESCEGWSSPNSATAGHADGVELPDGRPHHRAAAWATEHASSEPPLHHGQGTANAKDLPPVFSGIFYVAIVVYRCCNSVLDMLQSVVFRM
jgi:hypothetical protein